MADPAPIPAKQPRMDAPVTSQPNHVVVPAPPSRELPYLTGQTKLEIGRMDSLSLLTDLVLRIDAQNTLSGLVYDMCLGLVSINLPITRPNFIRMWKTFLWKRVHDVYYREKSIRAPGFIHLAAGIAVPAPLGDLLMSLGSFRSMVLGRIYHIIPPNVPAQNPPNWMTIDNAILQQYHLFVNRLMPLYTFREFPASHDFERRPICLTAIHSDGPEDHEDDLISVRSLTNEPEVTDCFLRFVNNELFVNNVVDYEEMSFQNITAKQVSSFRAAYVRSYVKLTNA